jgi:sugar/nucleoside kinase (ribokinase family)
VLDVVGVGALNLDLIAPDPGGRFHRQAMLPAAEIRDPTGAGDVYAAGLLAALATGRSLSDGVCLGMALARHKLAAPPSS